MMEGEEDEEVELRVDREEVKEDREKDEGVDGENID